METVIVEKERERRGALTHGHYNGFKWHVTRFNKHVTQGRSILLSQPEAWPARSSEAHETRSRFFFCSFSSPISVPASLSISFHPRCPLSSGRCRNLNHAPATRVYLVFYNGNSFRTYNPKPTNIYIYRESGYFGLYRHMQR